MWRRFTPAENQKYITIIGDKDAPPTRWWNHWWLAWCGWRTVAMLEGITDQSFRVGFRDAFGRTMICSRRLGDEERCIFCVLIGHEDCDFFAVDEQGRNVMLVLRSLTTTKEYHFHHPDGHPPLL